MPPRVSSRTPTLDRSRGVYAITPQDHDTSRLLGRVETVLAAGVTWLQYRSKHSDARLRRDQCQAIKLLCIQARVPLIVNDDVALAIAIEADGVHLGAHDAEVAHARELLGPDAIIGASCYNDLGRARTAISMGASYVAFGAVFPSPTKPLASRASLDLFRAALPGDVLRVAIGGITPSNAGVVVDAGADLIAVISGVFDAPDPAAAVRAYSTCFER